MEMPLKCIRQNFYIQGQQTGRLHTIKYGHLVARPSQIPTMVDCTWQLKLFNIKPCNVTVPDIVHTVSILL